MRGTGRQELLDLLVQPGDLGVDRVDQPQVHRDLGGVDLAEPAGQRLLQRRLAGFEPVVAEGGQRRRGPFPGDQGVQEPAAGYAEQVRDHHRDLQQRVLQDLLHPGLVPGLVLRQPGPGPGQHPQVPDGLRRNERAAQHPPLVQLAQPHAVRPVALAPPRQVLNVPGVDQPHLQARRLRQVIPDPPVIARGFQYQPLDALAHQVIHQRGHLLKGGLHPPHLLPPPARPRPRNPGADHPEPLRHIDRRRVLHDLRDLIGDLRAVTAVHRLHAVPRVVRRPRAVLPRGHRRLAFLRKPAGRGCPGDGAGRTESDRRARSDSTQPARSSPAPDFLSGSKHQAANGVTGSTPPSSTRTAPSITPRSGEPIAQHARISHPGTGHGAGRRAGSTPDASNVGP